MATMSPRVRLFTALIALFSAYTAYGPPTVLETDPIPVFSPDEHQWPQSAAIITSPAAFSSFSLANSYHAGNQTGIAFEQCAVVETPAAASYWAAEWTSCAEELLLLALEVFLEVCSEQLLSLLFAPLCASLAAIPRFSRAFIARSSHAACDASLAIAAAITASFAAALRQFGIDNVSRAIAKENLKLKEELRSERASRRRYAAGIEAASSRKFTQQLEEQAREHSKKLEELRELRSQHGVDSGLLAMHRRIHKQRVDALEATVAALEFQLVTVGGTRQHNDAEFEEPPHREAEPQQNYPTVEDNVLMNVDMEDAVSESSMHTQKEDLAMWDIIEAEYLHILDPTRFDSSSDDEPESEESDEHAGTGDESQFGNLDDEEYHSETDPHNFPSQTARSAREDTDEGSSEHPDLDDDASSHGSSNSVGVHHGAPSVVAMPATPSHPIPNALGSHIISDECITQSDADDGSNFHGGSDSGEHHNGASFAEPAILQSSFKAPGCPSISELGAPQSQPQSTTLVFTSALLNPILAGNESNAAPETKIEMDPIPIVDLTSTDAGPFSGTFTGLSPNPPSSPAKPANMSVATAEKEEKDSDVPSDVWWVEDVKEKAEYANKAQLRARKIAPLKSRKAQPQVAEQPNHNAKSLKRSKPDDSEHTAPSTVPINRKIATPKPSINAKSKINVIDKEPVNVAPGDGFCYYRQHGLDGHKYRCDRSRNSYSSHNACIGEPWRYLNGVLVNEEGLPCASDEEFEDFKRMAVKEKLCVACYIQEWWGD